MKVHPGLAIGALLVVIVSIVVLFAENQDLKTRVRAVEDDDREPIPSPKPEFASLEQKNRNPIGFKVPS